MKRTGPDSLRSWLAVLCCSLISMLLYGVVRLSGIMFVASMDKFQVDRQSASMPYILCDFLQAMAGPLTGFLSLKFGARQVMMLGSFIAAVGTGTCFLAQNIETITVLWGVVYGFGFGLSSLLLPAIVTQHFVKRRATAISLVYVGSYVGFSFLPSMADLLIHTYGLSGTYLFLSGFLLHCVPLSMLLQNPDISQDQKNSGTGRSRIASISIIGEYLLSTVKDSKSNSHDKECHDVLIRNSANTNSLNNASRKESYRLISDSIMLYKPKQHENHSIGRFRVECLDCGVIQDGVKSHTTKEFQCGITDESLVHDVTTKCNMNAEPHAIDNSISEKNKEIGNQTNSCALDTRQQSYYARKTESFFSNQELTISAQNQKDITKFFKPVAKLKYIERLSEYTKTDPKLLNFERIGSSSNIFLSPTSKKCYTEVESNKDVHRDKCSNDLFPVFVKPRGASAMIDDDLFEHPVKTDNKKADISDSSQMRRASTISKKELTISKCLNIFLEPIFLLVLSGNAVYASSFIAFITVIVDFSIDIGMSASDGKFVIMAFSLASNIGLLSFGWVTDSGYLSLTNFAALMLFLRTVTLCLIPYSSGFTMLMSVVTLQGFFEASLANMFPLIVAEYYIDEIHELAISCTLFLCGPMYLGTPLLIGFFRDDLGSYIYLFLLMAALSFTCSILLFITPVLAKLRCGRDDWILRKNVQ